eukprot:NODE_4921_length_1830_cov_15.742807.p1 GENE.NODE_4921_length_1830_cov_15.742807~~NODE_4921_length_1830_cov_15.742807.p1  ORF type:complete len:531 (-),score=164.10 NODE_4921_length_1830_cov_15.742807:236-1771(-)
MRAVCVHEALAVNVRRSQYLGARALAAAAGGSPARRKLAVDNLNPKVVAAEYAVRGKVVVTALELGKKLDLPDRGGLPFKRLITCSIGNPQALGQKPITFTRQVLSLVNNYSPTAAARLPPDVVKRAEWVRSACPPGIGAYSESKGVPAFRQAVANFIESRDGYPTNPDHIFLTDGASPSVQTVLRALIRDERDGIMLPIPQYPLYSASIALNGGTVVPYYLQEELNWAMPVSELRRSIAEARQNGINVRALAVINPGNPVGNVMSLDNIKDVLTFASEEGLVVLADEVYQENIWDDDLEFHSFKKVMMDMGAPANQIELFSFHSASKGFTGECGMRGGYMECVNIGEDVIDELYKLLSINLCSNVQGQVAMALITNPPKPGDPSFPLYEREAKEILDSLKRRANHLYIAFNKMEGVTCNLPQGALYTFPRIRLPKKAHEAAEKSGIATDLFYCLEMLKETGVVVVPGSGFGQVPGTLHYRSTILPPEDEIADVVRLTANFHEKFMDEYRE